MHFQRPQRHAAVALRIGVAAAAIFLAACARGPSPSATVATAFTAANRDWTVDEASQLVSATALGRVQRHDVRMRPLWDCVTGMKTLARVSIVREQIRGDRAVVFYRPVYYGKPAMWCTWGMQPAGGALVFPRDLPCLEERGVNRDDAPPVQGLTDVLCKLAGAPCDPRAGTSECTLPENYEILVREDGAWRLTFAPGSGLGARLGWLYPETRETIEALAAGG